MGFQLYITQRVLQDYTVWYLVVHRWLRDTSPRSAEPRVWLDGSRRCSTEFQATAQTRQVLRFRVGLVSSNPVISPICELVSTSVKERCTHQPIGL